MSTYSRASNRSSKRSTYKRVAAHSVVDETLFGNPDKRGKRTLKTPGGTKSVLTRAELEKLMCDPQTAFISKDRLQEIRGKVVPQSILDKDQQMLKHQRQKQYEAARARRDRIKKIDENKKKMGVKKLSHLEREQKNKDKKQIEISTGLMDEQIDEVKNMNSLMLYAQCVTIRDKQLAEKKRLKQIEQEEEKKLDQAMEIERLKALQMYEDRERKRHEDRRKGAEIIRAQMKEREKKRLREQELKEQEQKMMLQHIEKMKQEDLAEAKRKKLVTEKLMVEVANANREQIMLKQRQREQEIEEDERIAAYNKEKQLREEALVEEQRRIKAEKEREIARLRAMQEKAQDKAAELDALRAKRAQEEYERNWREKTRKEAEQKRKMHADLAYARQQQKQEKEDLIAEQARLEREQFERIIQHQKMEEEKEHLKVYEEQRRRKVNSDQLRAQISNTMEMKNKGRREYVEEGELQKKSHENNQERVELIRQKKIAQMRAAGIPSKYIVELERKNYKKTAL